jgi:hypothetical protein
MTYSPKYFDFLNESCSGLPEDYQILLIILRLSNPWEDNQFCNLKGMSKDDSFTESKYIGWMFCTINRYHIVHLTWNVPIIVMCVWKWLLHLKGRFKQIYSKKSCQGKYKLKSICSIKTQTQKHNIQNSTHNQYRKSSEFPYIIQMTFTYPRCLFSNFLQT